MIKTIFLDENVGLVKTNEQFIFIINSEIYGPFKNEQADLIYDLIKDISRILLKTEGSK